MWFKLYVSQLFKIWSNFMLNVFQKSRCWSSSIGTKKFNFIIVKGSFIATLLLFFQGVENVYTQHQPLLKLILEDLLRGRLRTNLFPTLGPQYDGKVTTVVVFVIGGVTYEEAYTVYQLNSTQKSQIVLGGTSVLNSRAFLDQVEHAFPAQQSANTADL